MALEKEKLTKYGVVAKYWKITQFLITANSLKADKLKVELYVSKDASDTGQKALAEHVYNWPIMTDDALIPSPFSGKTETANVYVLAYTWLKTRPEFADAIDV